MTEWTLQAGEPDLSLINQVPWIELDHAYGAAIDVPDQLRTLLSPDPDARRGVVMGFTCNIFHQGSTYTATVAAIPVLLHLLQFRQVPDRFRILEFLAGIAGMDDEPLKNASPLDDLRPSEEEDAGDCWRECFLAIAAGAPLYELLLGDDDPRVVISTAYLLSLIPAHAFGSSKALLALAQDTSRHDFIRSAALISLSYLNGGAVSTEHDALLGELVVEGASLGNEQVPLLKSVAAYCVLRDSRGQLDRLRPDGDSIAATTIEHGIAYPETDFYRISRGSPEDRFPDNPLDIFVPEPAFPWVDVAHRLRSYSKYRSSKSLTLPKLQKTGPDPRAYVVLQDVFDRDNVSNAVRRLHAFFRGSRSVPFGEFEPFKGHAILAWDVILELLDSEVIEDRWAAARVIEYIAPLDEAHVDQLIERLHRNNNSSLCGVIQKHPISARQCQELLERLFRSDFPQSEHRSVRDDYESIVSEHGTTEQVRQLFDRGERRERLAAAFALCRREAIDPGEALPVFAEAVLSGNPQARWIFTHWPVSHQWFLDQFDILPPEQRWAICDVMAKWRVDLSEQMEALFCKAESATHPVLQAGLIDLMAGLASPQVTTVHRLLALRNPESQVSVRRAIVKTLGGWSGRGIDEILITRLHSFANDPSTRVRLSVIDELVKFVDQDSEGIQRFLHDSDPELCRYAMWQLNRVRKLSANDLRPILEANSSDRLVSEALLAAATIEATELLENGVVREIRGPLTRSVVGWLATSTPS